MVVLTVGNAYLLVLADESLVTAAESQVATSKVSLDQAVNLHQAGTAPLLDELRARVDYQTLQQQLIVDQNALGKGPSGAGAHYRPAAGAEVQSGRQGAVCAVRSVGYRRRHSRRLTPTARTWQPWWNRPSAAKEQRKAATADRFPILKTDVDYGLIGVNFGSSHGTVDATGTVSVPVFKEFGLRGEAEQAQSQLDTQTAQLSDKNAQVDADVRDALLDIASAQQQVEVARSSVDLANEALSEAQQRYAAGVSNNLAVHQAEQSVAVGQ